MIFEQMARLFDNKRLKPRPLSDAERARRQREMDQVYGVFPGFRVFNENWVPPDRSWRVRLRDIAIYLAAVVFILPSLLFAIEVAYQIVTGLTL